MKKLYLLIALLFVSLPAAAEDPPAHYYIPPSGFNAAMQIMDLGFSNVFALFRNATGSFEFTESSKSVSNVKLAVDATSLIANNSDNIGDLMVLLGTTQYPEISFISQDSTTFTDGKAEIKGNLTVHGTTKPFTLDATLNHVGNSPRGGGMWSSEGAAIGLSLHGTFKRADFGITDDPNLKSRFGDTVTLMLETQAIKQ